MCACMPLRYNAAFVRTFHCSPVTKLDSLIDAGIRLEFKREVVLCSLLEWPNQHAIMWLILSASNIYLTYNYHDLLIAWAGRDLGLILGWCITDRAWP